MGSSLSKDDDAGVGGNEDEYYCGGGNSMLASCTASVLDPLVVNPMLFRPPPDPRPGANESAARRLGGSALMLRTSSGASVPVLLFRPPAVRRRRAVTTATTAPQSSQRWIVFSHGNATDVAGMADYCAELARAHGCGVALYDYVGYGASRLAGDPAPSQSGCLESLQATLVHLQNEEGAAQADLRLMGQSLGTGVVVAHAAAAGWTAPIMLLSPFTSAAAVMDVAAAAAVLGVDKFCSLAAAPRLRCPVTVVHGMRDDLVPPEHGRQLLAAVPAALRMPPAWIANAGHNDILDKIPAVAFAALLR